MKNPGQGWGGVPQTLVPSEAHAERSTVLFERHRAHNPYYGPCRFTPEKDCYSVLILQFFRKGVSRVESAFSLKREKLGPNRRGREARTLGRSRYAQGT